jgi:hypothetical protein
MAKLNVEGTGVWTGGTAMDTVRQLAGLCQQVVQSPVMVAPAGECFATPAGATLKRRGILGLQGSYRPDDDVVEIRVVLFEGPEQARGGLDALFRQLARLSDRVHCIEPETADGRTALRMVLSVKAAVLSLARQEKFLDELRKLDELARFLQEEIPCDQSEQDLEAAYKKVRDVIEPVMPLAGADADLDRAQAAWAREIVDYLNGAAPVAVAAPGPAPADYALALIARVAMAAGTSLGRLAAPSVSTQSLVEVVRRAPGILVVPVECISLGASRYEMGNEVRALLNALVTGGRAPIFSGTYEELQGVFHGGQGAAHDPLMPIVRHAPEAPLPALADLAVHLAGRRHGGLPVARRKELARVAVGALGGRSEADQRRILPLLARKLAADYAAGRYGLAEAGAFADRSAALSETFAGLCVRPRARRAADVQADWVRVLASPELPAYFREHLLAQDRALDALSRRLAMEALTRPPHQPIRYCAQGTPGTGKSESAQLLARRLDVPFVVIDAASMNDAYTVTSQLLGSSRGIVNSYQAGRLEQVAKHHRGAVVEVSDIDHASPQVQSALAALFFQVLENGEAQSSAGGVFSCANLIFAFTMNLPGGLDEAVRRDGIGYNNAPTARTVKKKIVDEIKGMLSGAFLSRIGTPILFEPLDGDALAAIVEHAVADSVRAAAERLGRPVTAVTVEAGVGRTVLDSLEASVAAFGARAILEHGRTLAAEAVLRWSAGTAGGGAVRVAARGAGELEILTH